LNEFDFQLKQLEGKDTQLILTIGHKLPRWPECHIPDWVNELPQDQIEKELFEMLELIVNRYKDNENLYAWQIENEVLFSFGICPKWSKDRSRLKEMVELVRQLDPATKILTSDSGELSSWTRTASLPIDLLGISLYRVAHNQKMGYFYWVVNPYFYKLHINLIAPLVKEVIITELQLEPWGPDDVDKLDAQELNKSFNIFNFAERIDFAQRTGATTILGWGVEWWYYMKEIRGVDEYWNEAIKIYNK